MQVGNVPPFIFEEAQTPHNIAFNVKATLMLDASIFLVVMGTLVVVSSNWWRSKPEESTGPRPARWAWQVHIYQCTEDLAKS